MAPVALNVKVALAPVVFRISAPAFWVILPVAVPALAVVMITLVPALRSALMLAAAIWAELLLGVHVPVVFDSLVLDEPVTIDTSVGSSSQLPASPFGASALT